MIRISANFKMIIKKNLNNLIEQYFLLKWAIPGHSLFFCIFNTVDSKQMFKINFADDCIRTATILPTELQPLPKNKYFWHFKTNRPKLVKRVQLSIQVKDKSNLFLTCFSRMWIPNCNTSPGWKSQRGQLGRSILRLLRYFKLLDNLSVECKDTNCQRVA